jgi:hypothetical protein
MWNMKTQTRESRFERNFYFDDIYLIDSHRFFTIRDEVGRLYTLENGSVSLERSLGKGVKNFALSRDRFLIAGEEEETLVGVYDLDTGNPLFQFPLLKDVLEGIRGEGMELRDSRILHKPTRQSYVVIDVDEERITGTGETGRASSGIYPLPPDENDEQEFLDFIAESIPEGVPTEVAGIINRFI